MAPKKLNSCSGLQHLMPQCHGSTPHSLAAPLRWGQGTAMLIYCR